MEEPLDEDGGSRVPSRPTAKKKDGLDDPGLADAGPGLNSPGEAVDQDPDLPKAVPEGSCFHGVDQSGNDGALGVSGNPDDAAPQTGSTSGDTIAKKKDGLDGPALADAGPDLNSPGEAVDQDPDLPKAVPEGSCFHGVDQSRNKGALGVYGNPDDVAPQLGSDSGDSTAKKKDALDDPAPVNTGLDLGSPGETVDQGPNHSEADTEEKRSHAVDQNRSDGAAGVFDNSDDIARRSSLNSGDIGADSVSRVSDVVAPVDENLGGVTAEVVQSQASNVALEVILNRNDVAEAGVVEIPAIDVSPGAASNSGDLGPAAISNPDNVSPAVRNSGNVAPGMAENFVDDALGSVQNLSNVALGADVLNPNDAAPDVAGNLDGVALEAVENPNDDSSEAVSFPSDVAFGGVENSCNVVLGSPLSPVNSGHVLAPNLENVATVAGNLNDDTHGVGGEPDGVASGADGELAGGAVQRPGRVKEIEIVEMEQNGASQADDQNGDPRSSAPPTTVNGDSDEIFWSKAVADQDCDTLRKLLAKDATYFWKFEKKNEVGTALHAAAARNDLGLAEHILMMLTWTQEAGDLKMRFSDRALYKNVLKTGAQEGGDLDMRFADTTLDHYVEFETDAQGNTALAVAQQKKHAAIEKKILGYIADKDIRRSYDKKSRASTGSSEVNRAPAQILKWNDAIKKKDCLALLQICPNIDNWVEASDVEKNLMDELVKVEVKNGKGGRQTALQTAAMQGCFKLARLMLNHMRRCYDENFRVKDIAGYILARDEVSGLTAFEMANDVIGNRSISQYIKASCEDFAFDETIERRLQLNLENDDHWQYSSTSYSFGAYPGTRWYRALEKGDTSELKKLVEGNSRLVLETFQGLTVLHVAVLCNDLDLVKAVLKLFCYKGKDGKPSIYWGKSYYPEKLPLHSMMQCDRNIDQDFFFKHCHTSSSKGDSKVPGIKSMFKQFEREGNSLESTVKKFGSGEILDECTKALIGHDIMTSDDKNGIPNDDYTTIPSWMCDFFAMNWTSALDGEIEKDVDFNFEDPSRKVWLRFHYACKDPLKFKDFLHQMALYIVQHPYDAAKLLQTWDGQGRTPFHILMNHFNDDKVPGWSFDEIFNHECFKEWIQIVENPRGKRIIDTILIKNYLQQNIILHPWTYFKVSFDYEKFECSEVSNFLYYQVAYLLKQKDMVQEIWSKFLEKKDLSNVMKRDPNAFNSMLFLAASTGNQSCLQSLLEINQDPMITDSNGRSLLHHAADSTILLSQLLGYCSLTIEDVIAARMKLRGSYTFYGPHPTLSTSDENLKASNIVQENSSNSTIKTKNSNDTYALGGNNIDISLKEGPNVERKACILMLLQAGVDLGQRDKGNKVPTIGPTIDASHQNWWYDTVVKDSTDKKIALGQAGNALSVVGTLVAATSYVGPLQPPLSFDNNSGYVKTNEPLIKVFMVSNSMAFYLAMASVMFAVVSSLPMPQEGIISELNRAKHVISLSLCLLQIAIGSIIISYATASIVAIQNEHLFHPSDLLFSPSIIGWFFCLLGIGGFLIRLARLMFYKNRIVRNIYHFSFSKFTSECLVWIILSPFVLILIVFVMIFKVLGVISSMIPLLKRRGLDDYFFTNHWKLVAIFKNVEEV